MTRKKYIMTIRVKVSEAAKQANRGESGTPEAQ